jgi:hypothetical protein
MNIPSLKYFPPLSWPLWYMPIIPVHGKLRQEDQEFKASLHYIAWAIYFYLSQISIYFPPLTSVTLFLGLFSIFICLKLIHIFLL